MKMMRKLSFGLVVALCLVGLLAVPSLASATVLDFEDLEHISNTIGHSMSAHNPYHGVTFYDVAGPSGTDGLRHSDNASYAIAHSGSRYLFNSYGYDNIYVGFSTSVMFEGVWAGYPVWSYLPPEYKAKEFWLEGYLGATKVGESAKITLAGTMQLCPANFGGPVDKVVFRRTNQSGQQSPALAFYTMDDITFSPVSVSAPDLIDNLSNSLAGLSLPSGTGSELMAKINAADKIIDDGNAKNDAAAIGVLEAFINSVQAQSGKKIAAGTAAELIDKARQIIDLLR